MRSEIQNIKKAEIIDKNRAIIASMKAADIDEQMTLRKATVEKLEAIEDDDKRV